MPDVIVVTGRRGAGKTELSCRLQKLLGWHVENVGDGLAKALKAGGRFVKERSQTGVEYLKYHSEKDYCRLVTDLAAKNVVLDGVRLVAAFSALETEFSIFHVHRTGKDRNGADHVTFPSNGFDADVGLMEDRADCAIEWLEDANDLDGVSKTDCLHS